MARARSKYSLTNASGHSNHCYYCHHYFLKGDIKRDKAIIQYARKPGLAHNQRWKYQDGFISSAASPHLVLDIRASIFILDSTSVMIMKLILSSVYRVETIKKQLKCF